ncbi:RES family NAD+ phosphorylase [Rhodobacter sp. HX-7-19]|uniref:RES family NAD+ phosphorylase n=1 Tax=Paragemmobacter kunshanensis TaxID=2583234 RepID=A0A6M1U9U1_9RHOB|nr:RES family NAD+ phosphorylase [Rhodobacter kunshanensis]NGQ91381.1 RES family NAD+ phosphorylase [Rhodobacter kunshanensis]
MSPPIWTPDALRSEARALSGRAWRFVEAQHRVSTLKLVDTLAEQAVLEDILDATKPPLPAECRALDYLLATPFRYRPYPAGSRFRRAGLTPGVWYGAETPEVAAAEMAFYRTLFYAESPATPFPDDAAEYTAFAADLATPLALDLTAGRLAADSALWTHPTDYAPCQALADAARGLGVGILRYRSVRDPGGGANLAVLTCRAFAAPQPTDRQTWRIRIGPAGVQALREHPRLGLEFPPGSFATDPRLAGMAWARPRAR